MTLTLNGRNVDSSNIQALYDANYSEGQVYPTLAAGATIVSATANWVFGTIATVVPENAIPTRYHVSAISIESCSDDGVFELLLYYGAADVPQARIRFAVEGGFFGNQVYLLPSVLLAANTRIRARLASSDGALNPATITMSVIYRIID